jgi:uncharacterized membrane protein
MNIRNTSHYGDILAIPFFLGLSIYFHKIKNKTFFEYILYIFSISGFLLDSYFTYIFYKNKENKENKFLFIVIIIIIILIIIYCGIEYYIEFKKKLVMKNIFTNITKIIESPLTLHNNKHFSNSTEEESTFEQIMS